MLRTPGEEGGRAKQRDRVNLFIIGVLVVLYQSLYKFEEGEKFLILEFDV